MLLHVIYASTSGNTEFVCQRLAELCRAEAPQVSLELQRAELASAQDLLRGDVLVLASGTWNSGGMEGQLNMHMQALLLERAADIDLAGKKFTFISLGDDRYYFTTRCTEHFQRFRRDHNATLLLPPLTIVNGPEEQREKIDRWVRKLLSSLSPS